MTEAETFDNNETESADQLDALSTFTIADLRKIAKMFSIAASRDWDKSDYIEAIKRKQASNSVTSFVFDSGKAPKEGYARIIIHRDATPGHKNSPVHLGFNGAIIGVPRGIEVDVPKPFIEILNNAETVTVEQASDATRDNPGGVYKDEKRPSYPFQVLAVSPGEYVNPNDNRGGAYKKKKAFFDAYGNWPTDGELKEWGKARMNRDMANEKNDK
jgi:hypothetical protein